MHAVVNTAGFEDWMAVLPFHAVLQQKTGALFLQDLPKALQKQENMVVSGRIVTSMQKDHAVRHIKCRLALPEF